MKKSKEKLNQPKHQDPYAIDRFSRIPMGVKVFLLKFWLAGAVYFFAGWGLFMNTVDKLDEILVIGVILGAVVDLFLNRLLNWMKTPEVDTDDYAFIHYKGFFSFLLNIVYCLAITVLIAYLYTGVNLALIAIFHLDDTSIPFGVEPIGFGLMFYAIDLLCVFIRVKITHFRRRKTHAA
jgi:hypothetical protein